MSEHSNETTGPVLDARFVVSVGTPGSTFEVEADLSLTSGVLILFGPSGAGKSLTLQALAGLVRPDRGLINVGGRVLFDDHAGVDLPAYRRRIGYVPQHHSLFPFLDVTGNVSFGLPRSQRRGSQPRVEALLEELGIRHLAKAWPASLSGGERQRVALARAMIVQPSLLLLDEPFASIDQAGRVELRRTLKATLDLHEIPAVFVTHDPEEALALGDQVTLFERGRSMKSGLPATLVAGAHQIKVTGRASGSLMDRDDGQAELRLDSAVVVASRELLFRAMDDGNLRLEARASSSRVED